MRSVLIAGLALVVGCSVPATTDASPVDTGDLVDPVVRTAVLDGQELLVAVVSTPSARHQGLRDVEDLGDLDGMVFWWGGASSTSPFTMSETLIPLDIAWFDAEGRLVDADQMVPCPSGLDCPLHRASGAYSIALERPAGSRPQVTSSSVLDVQDLP